MSDPISSPAAIAPGVELWPRDRIDLDAAYTPSRIAKDVSGSIRAWDERSAAARSALGPVGAHEMAYGPGPRQRYDVYGAGGAAAPGFRPIHVFLHGGFWQEGSRRSSGFPAPAFLAAGWIFVAAGYSLAPDASLTAITADVRAAIRSVRDRARGFGGDPDRIVVSGHSAGAQLAAALVAGPETGDDIVVAVAGLVLISGVYELAPLRACYVNDLARLSEPEVENLSPARHRPRRHLPVEVVVGGEETAAFRAQSRHLVETWRSALPSLAFETLPGRDHFDIVLDLADPASDLFRRAIGILDLTDRGRAR